MAKSKKGTELAEAPETTPLQQQILEALDGKIEPHQTTRAYRMAICAVAALNLLLPLLYLGLIFLIGHAIYWNALYNAPDCGGNVFTYIGGFVLGTITLLFLVKPLFARESMDAKPLALKRSAEPFLYEYVDTICNVVGAPRPHRICVDCQPNASARFSGGVMALLLGRLTLTIGLPLVAGLSTRQLTGILAHEFGHFSQHASMRMTFIVFRIQGWLWKIAFIRDQWDDRLESASKGFGLRLGFLLWAARFCVWLSRQLMFGLLWVGNAISCYMLRQMEFDADRYELRVVGSKTFIGTCARLRELTMAHQMALRDLDRFYTEGRLADDLPQLMVSNVPHITPEFRKYVHKIELDRQTGLFDSHPTDRERVAQAREANLAGVFQMKGEVQDPPASALFANYERLCKAVSLDLYRSWQGSRFQKSKLHPVRDLIKRRDAELKAGESLDRYFQVHIPVDRPLPLDEESDKPPARPQETLDELKASREKMLTLVKEYEGLGERYSQAIRSLHSVTEAVSLLECGLRIKGSDFELPNGKRKTADHKLKRARAAIPHLAAQLLEFEMVASERLAYALRLLQVPKVAARIPQGEALQEEIRGLIPDAVFVSRLINNLPNLYILYRRMHVLCSRFGERNSNPRLVQRFVEQLEGMHTRLTSMYQQMEGRMYPFDHKDGSITLHQFALPVVPEMFDVGGMVTITEHMVERLYALQVRLFARLTQAAEMVEQALGMPPLPERKTGS